MVATEVIAPGTDLDETETPARLVVAEAVPPTDPRPARSAAVTVKARSFEITGRSFTSEVIPVPKRTSFMAATFLC
jgi:hypothetical protein